ncbi:hypothetical protein GQR58_018751 [Nymphon striatum]|nr:hypothetical protein GQR58_018751 [Nymphon striatum]
MGWALQSERRIHLHEVNVNDGVINLEPGNLDKVVRNVSGVVESTSRRQTTGHCPFCENRDTAGRGICSKSGCCTSCCLILIHYGVLTLSGVASMHASPHCIGSLNRILNQKLSKLFETLQTITRIENELEVDEILSSSIQSISNETEESREKIEMETNELIDKLDDKNRILNQKLSKLFETLQTITRIENELEVDEISSSSIQSISNKTEESREKIEMETNELIDKLDRKRKNDQKMMTGMQESLENPLKKTASCIGQFQESTFEDKNRILNQKLSKLFETLQMQESLENPLKKTTPCIGQFQESTFEDKNRILNQKLSKLFETLQTITRIENELEVDEILSSSIQSISNETEESREKIEMETNELIDKLDRKRKNDQKMMTGMQESLENPLKNTASCIGQFQESTFEDKNRILNQKLSKLFETLQTIIRIENELEEFKSALGFLYKDITYQNESLTKIS